MTNKINSYIPILLENFPKSKQETKNLQFLYCIIYENETYIKEYIEKNEKSIETDNSYKLGLTPLIVATMLQKYSVIESICNRKPNEILKKDNGGYTPFHHAAILTDKKSLEILSKYANKTFCKEKKAEYEANNRSYKTLLKMRSYSEPTKQNFFYQQEGTKKIILGDGKKFVELTKKSGSKYFHDKYSFMTEKSSINSWKQKIKSNLIQGDMISVIELFFVKQLLGKSFQKAYEEFKKNPPKVFIKKESFGGWGLYAKEAIKKKKIVAIFFGEKTFYDAKDERKLIDKILKGKNNNNSYTSVISNIGSFCITDGSEHRDLANMSNDSFPNLTAATKGEVKIDGFSTKIVALTSTEDIDKNSPLVWNYGPSFLIKGERNHFELRNKALNQFVRIFQENNKKEKFPFLALLEKVDEKQAMSDFREMSMDLHNGFDKLTYLLDTPASLLLVLSNLNIDDISKCFDYYVKDMERYSPNSEIKDFSKEIKTLYPSLFQYIKNLKDEKIKTFEILKNIGLNAKNSEDLFYQLKKVIGEENILEYKFKEHDEEIKNQQELIKNMMKENAKDSKNECIIS